MTCALEFAEVCEQYANVLQCISYYDWLGLSFQQCELAPFVIQRQSIVARSPERGSQVTEAGHSQT
jgi:hypothetical protein